MRQELLPVGSPDPMAPLVLQAESLTFEEMAWRLSRIVVHAGQSRFGPWTLADRVLWVTERAFAVRPSLTYLALFLEAGAALVGGLVDAPPGPLALEVEALRARSNMAALELLSPPHFEACRAFEWQQAQVAPPAATSLALERHQMMPPSLQFFRWSAIATEWRQLVRAPLPASLAEVAGIVPHPESIVSRGFQGGFNGLVEIHEHLLEVVNALQD